jgi:predicted RNase H-like nuclease (RuvC/YqgF family)
MSDPKLEENYQKAIELLTVERDTLLDAIVEQKKEIERLKAKLDAAKGERHE